MSNHKVKPQLPTEEKVRKRGGVMQAKGYMAGRANGPINVYDVIGDAPSPSKLPDGSPVLVRNGGDLELHCTDSGAYKRIV